MEPDTKGKGLPPEPTEPITHNLDELTETVEIMKQIQSEVTAFKNNYISEAEFENKVTELVEKSVEEQVKIQNEKTAERRVKFSVAERNSDSCMRELVKAFRETDVSKRNKGINGALAIDSDNDELNRLKKITDEMIFVDAYFSARKGYRGIHTTDTFKRFSETRDSVLKAVVPLDTVDFSTWVPTAGMAEIIRLPEIAGKVENLFRHIPMPPRAKTYDYPLNITGASTLGEMVAEATTTTNPFSDTGGQELLDAALSLTAVKFRSRLLCSGELDEDSVVALVPEMKAELVRIHIRSLESAIINGDTTGTHQDSDVTAATDPRKAWKGLRYHGLNASSGALSASLATWSEDTFRGIRALMLSYGVEPMQCAWIVGVKTYLKKILTLDGVLTLDKLGKDAVVLTGQVLNYDGIPVIVSEHQREDLNASGVYDGVTETTAAPICVNRNYWFVGDKRAMTIEAERWLNSDQINVVSFMRKAFNPVQDPSTTYSVVGIGYNLTP